MQYNLAEKLAILKAMDEVVRADGQVKRGELKLMNRIMGVLKIDPKLLEKARNLTGKQSVLILSEMSVGKKQTLAVMLQEIAGADGSVDEREIILVRKIFSQAGIN